MTQKRQLKSEKEIYNFWIKENFFRADPSSPRKPYSLLVPPPNLTGELHLGHAMQHSIMDAVARFKKLQGYDVLLLPGVDHAGIAFETTFENELKKENLSKEKLGRDAWLKRAWNFKERIYNSVSESWRMMGLAADWEREVFTLDAGPQKAVYEVFRAFYEAGLIYRGPYIVQWCPKCNTAIEDLEMDYEEREESLYYVRYLIEGTKDGYIEIATARPETIFADTAIAVYPNHPKYKQLVGKNAYVPLPKAKGRLIPIFKDRRVEKGFGTGALKVTPGHDLLDYAIGKEHKVETLQVVDKNGRMTKVASPLRGMTVKGARVKAVDILKTNKALTKVEPYSHSVAVCERCKSVVEPLISEEWFIKVDQLAKEAIRVIGDNKIKFLPRNYAVILSQWLENIHDWCISRSLWWGHRIPVWYRDGQMRVSDKSPGPDWVQDEQVLDTWFSSGIWPFSTLGWPFVARAPQGKPLINKPSLDPALAKYYPWDFEISAPEIKYLWIARMIMLGVHFMGDVPFKTMFFHGMLRDLLGRKFSKSLGNGIEPSYLIEKWRVDATRMALYTYCVPGRDGRVSKEILDERGKNFRNFTTKTRNIARFIIDLKPQRVSTRLEFNHKDDQWIKDELNKLSAKVTRHLERLELHLAADVLYEFIWHELADVYIEKSKNRREDAQPVLEHVLKDSLILLHPFMPFLTEEIYQKFKDRKKSIMLEKWPSSAKASDGKPQ